MDHRWPRSLRAKGMLALAAVALLVVSFGLLMAWERVHLRAAIDGIEQLHRQERALIRVDAVLTEAVLDVTGASYANAMPVLTRELFSTVETAQFTLARVARDHPPAADWSRAIQKQLAELEASGTRADWIGLREALRMARGDVEAHRESIAARQDALRADVDRTYRYVTIAWTTAGVIAVVSIGLAVGGFFARMAKDLKALEQRAGEIVRGYRGPPLLLSRDDEVASLNAAVNRMAEDLRERELHLAVERGWHAYHDKMAALGALAAGIAHELNNPLAAIAGIVQEQAAASDSAAARNAEGILQQVDRAAAATRRLSALAASQPVQFEAVDVNEVLRVSLALLQYDPRCQRVIFDAEFPRELPAITTVPARLQQALFDLLGNCVDALMESGGRIAVRPAIAAGRLHIVIEDTRGEAAARAICRASAEPEDTEESPSVNHAFVLVEEIVKSLNGALHTEAAAGGLRLTLSLPLDPFTT